MLTPISILTGLLLGLVALALPLIGIALLYRGLRPRPRYIYMETDEREGRASVSQNAPPDPASRRHLVPWSDRWSEPRILIPMLTGAALLLFTLFGRHIIRLAFPRGSDEPVALRGTPHDLTRTDGTKIHVETFGPADGPTVVLTHGWSMDSTEWYYAKRQLANRFRLITWDLPGMGASAQPRDRDLALDQMASDLRAVLSVANGRPVVLVGHSIGGMINLTFCHLYPEFLGSAVVGVVQIDTSYTNPVRTTKNSRLSLALQKPVAEPLLHAMILLSPIVRVVNWLSYQEGLTYMRNAHSSFAGAETRGQVDLVSRSQSEASPAVVARGTLAMFHWDASDVLPLINVPVLILVGERDTTTLPSASEHMHAAIPASQLQIVAPGAHYSLLEQNKAIDAAFAQFATGHLK
jgi:pimeloyl-ACP methyl ester carboxylesterase